MKPSGMFEAIIVVTIATTILITEIKVGWKYFSVKQYNGLSKVSNIVSIHLVIFSSDELVLFVKECFSTCINSSIIWNGIKE